MSVVEKRPSDQPHVLVWHVVHHDGRIVAKAEFAGDATELLGTRHFAVGSPRNSVRPAQVYRAGNLTGGILLRRTGIDDAHVGVIQMLCKPIRFRKQFRVSVTTLMDGDD
jgi:hypothetical protein